MLGEATGLGFISTSQYRINYKKSHTNIVRAYIAALYENLGKIENLQKEAIKKHFNHKDIESSQKHERLHREIRRVLGKNIIDCGEYTLIKKQKKQDSTYIQCLVSGLRSEAKKEMPYRETPHNALDFDARNAGGRRGF